MTGNENLLGFFRAGRGGGNTGPATSLAARGVTRAHALAEVFSTITGNPKNRADAQIAAEILANLALSLDFVDLTAAEMLAALKSARKLGVRGGRVHDFFHAVAAKKSGAKKIVTLDKNDFVGLTEIALEII